jgi:hypothetical protein
MVIQLTRLSLEPWGWLWMDLRVNSGRIYSSPYTTTFNYNQNALEGYFWTYLTR